MRFTRARVSPAMRAEARSESITIGAGYFAFFAGVGAFGPYSALYYRHLGFTGPELGILAAIPAIAMALTGPLWGVLADSRGWHRHIMRVAQIIAAILAWLMAGTTTFSSMAIIIACISIVLAPVPSIWDAYAVSAVERGGAPFGILRIFGSLGYIVMVFTIGRVMAGGLSTVFIYTYFACFLLTFLVTLRLPPLGERRPRRMFDGMADILHNGPYKLLLLTAFLIAVGYASLNLFLAIHIDSLGGSTAVSGVAFATASASELPIIGMGAIILKRLGARRMITIALVFYALRFGILGVGHHTSTVFLAQLCHGLSFGMFLVASVTLAHRLVGGEYAATAQVLLAMVGGGIGNISGSLIGGFAIDYITTSTIYKIVAVSMTFTLIVFAIGSRRVGRDAYDPPPVPA